MTKLSLEFDRDGESQALSQIFGTANATMPSRCPADDKPGSGYFRLLGIMTYK